jgi:hypothetical protein
MDLGVTLIGIIIVVLCAMPFTLTYRNRKKKEKQFLLSLKELAQHHNCKITQYEVFGYFAIGIDDAKSYVFFVLKTEEKLKQQYINLSNVKTCEITKINRSINKKETIIDHLSLNFGLVDKSKPNIALDFYNSDISYQLSGEIQSIEKWYKLINDLLKSKK